MVFREALHSFYDSYDSGRTFKLDMAGFAVNLEYFRYRENVFLFTFFLNFAPRSVSEAKNLSYISMPNVRGHEEDDFLKMLDVQVSELEVRAMRQSVQNYNFILSKIPRFSLRPRFWSGTQRQFH